MGSEIPPKVNEALNVLDQKEQVATEAREARIKLIDNIISNSETKDKFAKVLSFENMIILEKMRPGSLMELFTEENSGTYTVNFRGNSIAESKIGLGDITGQEFKAAGVLRPDGQWYYGTRGNKPTKSGGTNRVGFFSPGGDYLEILTGYQFKISTDINDENLFEPDTSEVEEKVSPSSIQNENSHIENNFREYITTLPPKAGKIENEAQVKEKQYQREIKEEEKAKEILKEKTLNWPVLAENQVDQYLNSIAWGNNKEQKIDHAKQVIEIIRETDQDKPKNFKLMPYLPLIFAQIENESSWNPRGENKSKLEDSIGLMQINYRVHGKEGSMENNKLKEFQVNSINDLYNLDKNVRYGTWFLSKKLEQKGNIIDALDAYNGGGNFRLDQNKRYSARVLARLDKYTKDIYS